MNICSLTKDNVELILLQFTLTVNIFSYVHKKQIYRDRKLVIGCLELGMHLGLMEIVK